MYILSRDGTEKGKIINWESGRTCSMEGCCCSMASVRWDDGKLTYCCHGGLKSAGENTYQIM